MKKKCLRYAFLMLIVFFSSFVFGFIPSDERAALIALYNSTDGDNWTNNSGWKEPPLDTDGFSMPGTEGTWYGINVYGNHVTEIDLRSNQLKGIIPTNMGNLSYLQNLYLSVNQFTGSIPLELGNLSNLQKLYLTSNQLIGNIPPELGNLSNLQELSLYSNQLSGNIPQEFGNFRNLQSLWLSLNHLTGGIPIELGNLGNIRYLDLSNNQLSGSIPTSLINLTKLNSPNLDIGYNCLYTNDSELREWLDNVDPDWESHQDRCGSISTITLTSPNGGENWAVGYSYDITWTFIGDVRDVKIEYTTNGGSSWAPIISSTANYGIYTWTVPGTTSSNCKIRISEASDGEPSDESDSVFSIISSIPAQERAALIALYNSTSGDNWTNNSGWKEPPLHTDGFAMPGTEENWFGITVENALVTEINLYNNNLNGNIPYSIGNLQNLTILNLPANSLTDNIPDSIGNLSSLYYLSLESNQFTGNIPSEIGNLSKLNVLNLGFNQFTGSIPTELSNMSHLIGIILTSNQFTGNIPYTIGNLSNLRDLRLDSNQLTSNIPPELGNLSKLERLSLNSNQITDEIPDSLGNLSNLKYLYLYSNKLTGNIPTSLGNLSNLLELALDSNQFTGNIPPELGSLTNLLHLGLDSNQLTGDIPSEMGNLSNLKILYLNGNKLTGIIPPVLGNLSNLEYLKLNNNLLNGEIPTSLTNLTKLSSPNVDIGYNCLYTNDADLRAWLDSVDPDWESHQDQCVSNPTVSTNVISSITSNSAVSGGNVTSDGGATVTARGVCWSTSSNPTIVDSKTIDGNGTGSFTSNISVLSPNTTYYVRAYATNSQGTSYGSNRSFTTISSTTTNTLYVKSTPETGVYITLSPNDNNSLGNGTTNFTRTYNSETLVTLTAPSTFNGKNFLKWLVDGVDKTGLTINVTMDIDHTAQAVYQASTYTLTVQSSPDIGVPISVTPNDNNGEGDGSTALFRTYDYGTIVTLTAPSSYSSRTFLKWLIDGSEYINRTINVTMNQNHEVQAVYQSDTYTLTVQSSPYNGVSITVDPSDNNGDGNGSTNFTRTYDSGTKVTLTAPSTVNGNHFIKWTVSGQDNTNPTIQVTMEGDQAAAVYYETSRPPEIAVNRKSLNLGYIIGSSNIPKETFIVYNNGGGTLNWSVSTEMQRIGLSPASGTNYGSVEVSVGPTGLIAGKFRGVAYVSDPLVSNSPLEVEIKLWIKDKASPPFGEFATPVDNSTVYSSIPVSGWALGDTGVESVKIYREEGSNLVYIGDAVFVEGARPDVEAAYPDYPMNYKAGWGYMMLSNFLPNGGNGTYRIHAIATDKEGRTATLGVKTIHVDNANAVKPFGAIDKPEQGGNASGSKYINWGWVLTPQPNSIPCDGSTIKVWVDGVNLGHPTYCIYRKDIANLFPDYANYNKAVGYFYLDTTAYEDGVHTIQWTATDNAGNTDGIGSRYFTIQNTGCAPIQRSFVSDDLSLGDEKLSSIPINYFEPIILKKGYQPDAKTKEIYPDNDGIINLKIRELERLEIQLSHDPLLINGYMIVGDKLKNLPIGSFLDIKSGTFYWQPGAGFFGEYHFVFFKKKFNGEVMKKNVLVKILPKYEKNKTSK